MIRRNPPIKDNLPKESAPDNDANRILIIRSKIFRPTLRREFVRRQSLIDRLEANLSYPLTLISAATGCGKSVAVSQWLEETQHKYGWLSLDEEHNDIQVFLAYLVAIFKEQWPQKTFGLEYLLEGANLPANLIATTLINDLDQSDDLFVLVLDDYQMIREGKIHEIVNSILRYPPEHFHLVILTQRDPPLKLARLRAQYRLNEVRMKDLAFTADEALELRSLVAAKTPDDQVITLVKESEGWITGIMVGLMGLAEGINFRRVVQSMNSQNSVISELFEEVVINGLTIATQKYLELTALLDRFSVELINAMIAAINDGDLSPAGSEEFIRLSKRRNLFLIPLDSTGQWYRYHHLFRSEIKKRARKHFSEEVIASLYKAASRWFEDQQLLEEALKYAILSDDMPFAVNLFDDKRLALHNSEQFQRLERLIKMFPEEAIERNPELLLSLAILQDHKANYYDIQKYLDEARQLLNKNDFKDAQFKKLKGQFHCVSAYLPFMQGDFDASIRQAEIGLDLLPANEPNYFREFALAYYALAHQAIGKTEIGLNEMSRTLEGPAKSDKYFRGRLLHIKTLIHLIAGDAKEMSRAGMQLQALHSPQNYPGAWMAGIYSVVTSDYISNKLEKVHQFHEELIENRFAGRPFGVVHHLLIECLASHALGDWDSVDVCISKCKELAADLGIPPLEGMVYAFEVEIALRRNDFMYATEVAAMANFNPHPPLWYFYIPQLSKVKLLFQTNQEEKAQELLENLLAMGRRGHNKMLLVQALALQAIVHANEAHHDRAKNVLNEALLLAKGKKNIRAFLDQGDTMYHLIRGIAEEQPKNEQVLELLQVFKDENCSFSKNGPISTGKRINQVDELSKRELEILLYVSKGYKNEEIANTLFISIDTVKKHLYRTYQKLDVKNRVAAVKKVRKLGLIASE